MNNLTGNPFVDTGLAVIAARSGLDSVGEVTLDTIRSLHKDGEWLARDVCSLKSFTMIFTRNALLTNGKSDPESVEERIKIHAAITSELLNYIGRETVETYCQACGNPKSLDFSATINRVVSLFDREAKDRFVGRDWFPLVGSLGSDAQSLPSASAAVSLCARCLLLVQYLPLGVRLFGNELAVFQSTSEDLWYSLVRRIVSEEQRRIADNQRGIIGSKEGKGGLIPQLLETFRAMRQHKGQEGVDELTLHAWRFSNSTSPNIEVETIPNFALQFLWKVSFQEDLTSEIARILKLDRRQSFFSSLVTRAEYYGLYPGKLGSDKKHQGVSHRLFYLYQTEILRKSPRSLRLAYQVAREGFEHYKRNDGLKSALRLARSEAFNDARIRSQFKKIMAEEALQGRFGLRDYVELFPYRGEGSVSVSWAGWNLIRYYIAQVAMESQVDFGAEAESQSTDISWPMLEKVRFVAFKIFEYYVRERGTDRFRRDVLGRVERGKLDSYWLRSQFTILARKTDGFTIPTWRAVCYSEDSRSTLSEFLFQCRLLWSQWLASSTPGSVENPFVPVTTNENLVGASDLPPTIANGLVDVFTRYVQSRGLERFERDVLRRLGNGELGPNWYRNSLGRSGVEGPGPDEIDAFLEGSEEGTSFSEKIFRMQLLLNNLYRIRQAK